jgi:hypothetical protein
VSCMKAYVSIFIQWHLKALWVLNYDLVLNVYLDLVSLTRSHVVYFVIYNLYTAWCFQWLSNRVRCFIVTGKHLYLQRYKKETQELSKWKIDTQTGVINRSDRSEPSAGHLGILENQRLSTRIEYDSNLSHSL